VTEQEQELAEKKEQRRVQLTKRDLSVLLFIGEQYVIRFDQLQRLLGKQAGLGLQTPGMLSESAARVWVARMKAIKAIEQEKPYRAQPAYIWLTRAGLRLAHLDFKPLRPATSTLNHLYWCNQARLFMEARRPGEVWVSERRLRSEQAQAIRQRRGRQPETPDAHLLTQKGTIAIEIEISDKQAARLVELLRRRATEYYTVWYFCSNETQKRVESAKKELISEIRERIQIYSLSQLSE
jgi:hypothetical protein